MEERSRQTTVLFADVSGSTQLYETAGDVAALDAIGLCIGRLSQAAESTGGRGVKNMGGGGMGVFSPADAAAERGPPIDPPRGTPPPGPRPPPRGRPRL